MNAEYQKMIADFWREALDPKRAIIVNGKCYTDGGRTPTWPQHDTDQNGFEGRFFNILIPNPGAYEPKPASLHARLSDGSIILKTNNLWLRGDVPEEYREEHPNNAMFVDRFFVADLDKTEVPEC